LFTTGAAGYVVQEISMNSPFDPLYTVGGGNCTGFATLMLIYSRCYVKSARIQTQIATASNPGDVFFILPARSDEAAAGIVPTIDMVTEGQNNKFNLLTNSPSTYMVLSDTRSPVSFQGLPATSNRDELSCSAAVDPTIQPAWFTGLLGAQGHTALVLTLVEYSCTLYRPNTLGDA
jgi:hypothetical protein